MYFFIFLFFSPKASYLKKNKFINIEGDHKTFNLSCNSFIHEAAISKLANKGKKRIRISRLSFGTLH